ncbi:MAG: hypothetical protein J1F24_06600 [Oscillospiraceae bacterium]|nr:hypothetical protein [Oscillospiraceae bacterium]
MSKKKIYTIANSHLDTVWCWDFETTVKKYIPATLSENFALFEKYPDYRFSFEGAYRYELIREYYPDKWEKLKKYITEGRWNICGSAFENGDVNIPSPEALFRNILLGNRFFEKNFGKRSVDIFLPDCFGFGYALPSVMHHANLKGFTTQKLSWGSAYGIPFDIGKWYGVDGNFVYAVTNPGKYDLCFKNIRNYEFVTEKLNENEKNGINYTTVFHGSHGDTGGAPPEKSVKVLQKEINQNENSDIEIISAAADDIYRDIENMPAVEKQKLPVWNNELVMTNHAVGGYTSRAVGKRWNRRNEELADMAERACVAAEVIANHKYPDESLRTAWKRVIAHQFHDDIPGTSVQRAYKRSWNDYALSMNAFSGEYEAAVSKIAKKLDTSFVEGTPVIVVNPMEYERTDIVKITLPENIYGSDASLFDADGKEYPAQIIAHNSNSTEILAVVTVPALGYKVFDLKHQKSTLQTDVKVSQDVLENEKYIVTLNSQGNIASIFDKELKREILSSPITIGIFDYNGSNSWPAWEMNFDELNRKPQHTPQIKSAKIVENGPCRVAIKIVKTYGESVFTSIISLSSGGKYVEVQKDIEWRSLRSCCKEIFPFTAENKTAVYDLGLGTIKRGNMNEKLFEVPAQKWADITDKSGEFGVSILSECKYGWDKFDDNTLRLTVVHTPRKNYKIDSMQSMMDLGLNKYSYAIYSHEGSVGRETQSAARDFIMPLTSFVCSKHAGTLGTEFSFGSLSSKGAILRAMKKAEDGDEIIIRIGESEKKMQKNIEFSLSVPIESARLVYASEEHIADFPATDGKLVFDLEPFEIKSFALTVKREKINDKDTMPLSIPSNISAFSSNSNSKGTLPEIHRTIPEEITPKEIYVNGISFDLSKRNAVLCGGQVITPPTGTKKVHFLAASLNGDRLATFGDRLYEINDIKEYFAGWDLYDYGEAAFTKNGKLGFEFTHSHSDKGDEIASQLFFWIVTVDVDGKGSVTLPYDRDIIILAATADTEDETCTLATQLYDKIEHRFFDYKMSAKDRLIYDYEKTYIRINDKRDFFTAGGK